MCLPSSIGSSIGTRKIASCLVDPIYKLLALSLLIRNTLENKQKREFEPREGLDFEHLSFSRRSAYNWQLLGPLRQSICRWLVWVANSVYCLFALTSILGSVS